MAKFIIEVSDEYIRDIANVNKIQANLSDAADKDDAIATFLDAITFSTLVKSLDDGVSEFVFSQDNLASDKSVRRLFRNVISYCAAIKIAQEAQEKENSENKNKQAGNVETDA